MTQPPSPPCVSGRSRSRVLHLGTGALLLGAAALSLSADPGGRPLFRLGSGTSVPFTTAKPLSSRALRSPYGRPLTAFGRSLTGVQNHTTPYSGAEPYPRALTETAVGEGFLDDGSLEPVITVAGVAAVVSVLLCMMPAGGNMFGGDNNRREVTFRTPPSWSPEHDGSYSLRAYVTDVALWVMLTDLQPHQQCAAMISRLGGAAREGHLEVKAVSPKPRAALVTSAVARMISPQEMIQGGLRDGVQLDPVTNLLAALQDRFAPLDEETRLQSMTEMLAFTRRPNERINEMISRHENTTDWRAMGGGFPDQGPPGWGTAVAYLGDVAAEHIYTPYQQPAPPQPCYGPQPYYAPKAPPVQQPSPSEGGFAEAQGLRLPVPPVAAFTGPSGSVQAWSRYDPEVVRRAGQSLRGHLEVKAVSPKPRAALVTSEVRRAAAEVDLLTGRPMHQRRPEGVSPRPPPDAARVRRDDELSHFGSPFWLMAGGGFSWFRSEPSTGQSRRSFGLAPHIWILSTVCGASTEDRGDSRGRETTKIKNVGPGGYARRARCHRGNYSHSFTFRSGRRCWGKLRPIGALRGVPPQPPPTSRRTPQTNSKAAWFVYSPGPLFGGPVHYRSQLPPDRCQVCLDDARDANWMKEYCPYGAGRGSRRMQESPDDFAQHSSYMEKYCLDSRLDLSQGHAANPGFTETVAHLIQGSTAKYSLTNEEANDQGRSLAALNMNRANYAQAAIASLVRGYRAGPAEAVSPMQPRPPPAGHPSASSQPTDGLLHRFFNHVENADGPNREDLTQVAHASPGTIYRRQPPKHSSVIPQCVQAGMSRSMSVIGNPNATAVTELVLPPHSFVPQGLAGGIPPVPTSASSGLATDSLENVRVAIAQATAQRAQQRGTRAEVVSPSPVPPSPAAPTASVGFPRRLLTFQEMCLDIPTMQRSGYTASHILQMLEDQAQWREGVAAAVRAEVVNFMPVVEADRAAQAALSPQRVPTPVDDDGEPPHVYDEAGVCSICTNGFMPGERVCRLRCRHMFYCQCWEDLTRAAAAQPRGQMPRIRDDCPNCRGRGIMLTTWEYVDPALLFQMVEETHALGQYVATEPPPEQEPGRSGSQASDSPRNSESSTPRPVRYWVNGQPFYPVMIDPDGGGGFAEAQVYHALTRLRDGRPSLLIDCGSVGNLCGENWARSVGEAAEKAGKTVLYTKRSKSLNVRGVGPEAAECTHDLTFPIALRTADGRGSSAGTFITPTIPSSDVPGLLGLTALHKNRAILDCNTLQLHCCGPDDYHLDELLPPGTETYKMEIAPSGHLVLPCCEYFAKGTSSSSASLPPPLVLLNQAAKKVPPPPAQSPRLGMLKMAAEAPAPLADPPGLSRS